MGLLNIKNWTEEKKVKFSIILALFLTILIVILSFYINSFMSKKEGGEKSALNKENIINLIKDTFKVNANI